MTEHRCSQCGRTYSSREYRDLDTVERTGPDPDADYGVETVCECGARFHSDKWQLVDDVEHDGEEFTVSTVALTIAHGPDHKHWFETAIDDGGGLEVERRYETQDEAEEGHEEILEALKAGEYSYEIVARRLVIDDAQ